MDVSKHAGIHIHTCMSLHTEVMYLVFWGRVSQWDLELRTRLVRMSKGSACLCLPSACHLWFCLHVDLTEIEYYTASTLPGDSSPWPLISIFDMVDFIHKMYTIQIPFRIRKQFHLFLESWVSVTTVMKETHHPHTQLGFPPGPQIRHKPHTNTCFYREIIYQMGKKS